LKRQAGDFGRRIVSMKQDFARNPAIARVNSAGGSTTQGKLMGRCWETIASQIPWAVTEE